MTVLAASVVVAAGVVLFGLISYLIFFPKHPVLVGGHSGAGARTDKGGQDRGVVRVKKLDPRAQLPEKATEGSSWYDIRALKDIRIAKMAPTRVRTGLAFELWSPDVCLEVVGRSGLFEKGVVVHSGKLDYDYRGELIILMFTLELGYQVAAGERIAQVAVRPVIPVKFRAEFELSPTARGEGGMGSTGRF